LAIDGLLEYASVGQMEIEIESVGMVALLAEAIDALAPAATFTIEIADNLPTLEANRLLLFQVFLNLVGNGITHHDRADGSIQICAQERSDFYEFAVADDGSGIASEQHDRIFEISQPSTPKIEPIVRALASPSSKRSSKPKGGRFG
jgi:signal transduction histidine kinase